MSVSTNKTKVIIFKSRKITYANFVYDNNKFEEVDSYKYLGFNLHRNVALRKGQMEGGKLIMGLKIIVN
jgi:hypothetical protein